MRTNLLVLLILAGWLQPARAEEPHTFWGKTVEGWIAVYRDKASTEDQRRQAVAALGCFGPEAKAAVPDLTEAVRKGQLPAGAVNALLEVQADVRVPVLIQEFLKQGCQHLTGQGTFGFNPSIEDSLVRIGGPAVPALLEILNGPNGDMRVCAATALGKIGPAARAAVPSLIRAIERPDPKSEPPILVLYAIRALGRLGPEAKAAVPALNEVLVEKGDYDYEAVLALVRIGAPPVKILLDTFLREADPFVAERLASLGPKAREAVPSLTALLKDKRPQARFSAAIALAHIEPSGKDSIPVLIEALSHLNEEDFEVWGVPEALARLGPRAGAALPSLIGLLRKGSTRTDLLEALVQIDPAVTECVPVLIEALKSEDDAIRDTAANCLGLLGPRAKGAVPALALALSRDFEEDAGGQFNPQISAAKALRRIGPEARTAVPALIAALKPRRIAGVEAGGIGDPGERRDWSTAAAAAEVLGSLGPGAKSAIPALIEVVRTPEKDDADWFFTLRRHAAILALARIGPEARTAIPALRDLLNEHGEKSQPPPELVIALYQLAPDGTDIAERWLEKPMSRWFHGGMSRELEARARVLGALGRTSVEGDYLTRHYLERIDRMIADSNGRDDEWIGFLEEWFELIGRLGSGARLAIPRLNEFLKYPHPWVRMWAAETLERIVKVPPAKAK